MKITIKNHFHNTQAVIIVSNIGQVLTEAQITRAEKQLCGMADCVCGGLMEGNGAQDDHGIGRDDRGTLFAAW